MCIHPQNVEETLMILDVFFLIRNKDDELLEKYNEICEKLKKIIKNKFDNETVYNGIQIGAKIKSYDAKINMNFQNNKINEITKESLQFICLSVTLIDFIFKICKIYYPQVFVEKCKYLVKEKNMP